MATTRVRTSSALLLCYIMLFMLASVVVGYLLAPRAPWSFMSLAPGSTVTTFTTQGDCLAAGQLHHWYAVRSLHSQHHGRHSGNSNLDFCSDFRTRVSITSDAKVTIDLKDGQ